MSQRTIIAALGCITLLALFWLLQKPDPKQVLVPPGGTTGGAQQVAVPPPAHWAPTSSVPASSPEIPVQTAAPQTPTVEVVPPHSPGVRVAPQPGVAPGTPVPDAEIVLEQVRSTLREYGLKYGGNPVGNNAEITAALNGGNPKQIKFIDPNATPINGKGEMVDPWGTPYFFHQLSATETEIRSAGPDRRMYSEDDLVVK